MNELTHGIMYKEFEKMEVPKLKLTLRKFWSTIVMLQNALESVYDRYLDLVATVTDYDLESEGRCIICGNYVDDIGHADDCKMHRYRSWRLDRFGIADHALINIYELKKEFTNDSTRTN